MVGTEIKKCIFSVEMMIGVFLVAVCFAFGVSSELKDYFDGRLHVTIFYMYNVSIFSGIIGAILPIISVLPIVNILVEESSSGYEGIAMLRSTRRRYVAARILSTIISGIFVILIGSILFIAFLKIIGINLSISGNINPEDGLIDGTIYYRLTENGHPIISLCLMVFIFLLTAIPWVMLALVMSQYVKNKYAIIICPFLIKELLIFVCYPFDFLYYFSPLTWNVFTNPMMCSPSGGLVYELIVQMVIIIICSIALGITFRRRYRYG